MEIGITTTISKAFAFELLRPLFSDPDVFVRITESTVDHLLIDFKQQKMDVLVTHERLSSALIKRLKAVPLREPEMVFVGSSKYKRLISVFPKGISGSPFFLFTKRTPLRWEIEKFFKAHNIVPILRGEVDDVDLLKAAAVDGLGITVLPAGAIQPEITSKKLFVLSSLPMDDIRTFAYYIGESVDASTQKVINLLEKKSKRA